ncbi:MAG: VanW family protein [Actinomycetota bacterium]
MFSRLATLSGVVVTAIFLLGGIASAQELPPGGTFIDDDGDTHEPSIEAIYAEGITKGCDERRIRFCPDDPVTRGEMAAFLVRSVGFPSATEDHFVDDDTSIFEGDINRIAEAEITLGCNPPDNTRYCPDRGITRAEMATLLVRSFPELIPESAPDAFGDDDGNVHESDINKIAAAGITVGCNPPENTQFCPRQQVTRAQMATFLLRALGLDPIEPPPQKPIERVSRFTTFHDCCQNRVHNIQTMARAVDGYVVMPGETFSIDRVVGPRTSSKGYLPAPYLINGEGACCAVGGGVSQFGTTIHNAVFWGGYQIDRHQPHSGWINRYPLGIEATLIYKSIDFRFTNDTTTPIRIRTSYTSTSITVELWGNQGSWEMIGYHPRGARNSVIDVLDRGGSEAKRVSATVTGSAPGTVRVTRTLTQGGSSSSQTWWWNYVS